MSRYLFSILAIFIFAASIYPKDVRIVEEPKGLGDYTLGKTLNDILYICKKKDKLYVDFTDFKWIEEEVDPYLLLAKKFNTTYNKGEISIDMEGEKYFLDFNKYIVDTTDYHFSYSNSNNYIVKYKKLRKISITDPHELIKIHNNISHLNMAFFRNKMYEIAYGTTLNLDEINRLITNFRARYGKFIGHSDKVLFWYTDDIQIKISFNKPIIRKLYNIDKYRTNPEVYKDIKVKIYMLNDNIYSEVVSYKEKNIDNLIYTLKAEVNRRVELLKEALGKKKYKKHIPKYIRDYSLIDKL